MFGCLKKIFARTCRCNTLQRLAGIPGSMVQYDEEIHGEGAPFRGKTPAQGGADAAGATRHEHHLAGEAAHYFGCETTRR
jgi:hypothetical protein